ncbi:hypothetical protein [Paraburkholderia sp. BCC1886]|uniref:hypothetical protein n=1 Tax=Paraburkholderia sp. BCC1886 TaxID=2562670 RepID=UPI0011845777|nr:hypothetical protein [Paraburkholderia sp. BCC1886]
MLDTIKEYATLIIGTLVVAAILGLGGYGLYEAHQVKSLISQAGKATQQITDLTNSNKNLTAQIKTLQQSGKVNDQVAAADTTQKATANTTQVAVNASTQTQIIAVKKHYQPQGTTQVLSTQDQQAEETAISTIQIDAAWQTYCNNTPAGTAGCTAASTTPASTPAMSTSPPTSTTSAAP